MDWSAPVGRVELDGGEVPSRVGFAVSPQILFDLEDTDLRFYDAEGSTFIFEVVISDLEPGQTYYLRSFAENSAGLIFGSVKRLKIENDVIAPFDALPLADGWYRSPWFGTFKETGSNWVFHPELGWVYHGDENSNGTWLWIERFGWSWSRGDLWPYLWVSEKNGWIYYMGIHWGEPTFWDYEQAKFIR